MLKVQTARRNHDQVISKKNTGFVQLTTLPPTPLSPDFPAEP